MQISRIQQQQFHACNSSNITHATTAVLCMQISLMKYHSYNNTHAVQACNQDVQLDLVGDHSSWDLGAQPPDADKNLIFDVLEPS